MILDGIWKIGVTETMDLEERKQIMFSNGVYVIAVTTVLLAEIVIGGFGRVFSNPTISNLTPFIMSALALFCLALNKQGHFTFSRIVFLIVWTVVVSVLPITTKQPTSNSYFFHTFYLILTSPVIHLLFSAAKDRNKRLILLSISMLMVFFSIDFVQAFDTTPSHVPYKGSLFRMQIIFTAVWFFLNLMISYLLRVNGNFYESLREQKELIASQGKKLERQNDELLQANQKLTSLNEQIHTLNSDLEKRVNERTLELTERNRVLSDYAFMNAHLLRSPVSRIKGLINLFNITDDPEEKKIIGESLLKSAEELDDVVRSISKKLNEVK